MRQRRESRVELRLRVVEKILRFVREHDYQELLLDAVRSYYRLSGRERKLEEQLVRSGRYGEVEAMAQTWLDRVKARERQEGRQEGEELALQRAAVSVVTARFPETPPALLARIERLQDRKVLDELVHRAAVANRLAEIEALLGTTR